MEGSGGVKKLVVDSGGFVKRAELWRLGESVWTVGEVVAEIRDAQTRAWLQTQPAELHVSPPSPDALHFVSDFAKATGDFPVLSATDLKVVALAWELHRQAHPDAALPSPKAQATHTHLHTPKPRPDLPTKAPAIAGFHVPSAEEEAREAAAKAAEQHSEELESAEKAQDSESGSEGDEEGGEGDGESGSEGSSSEESEDGGWITAGNLAEAKRGALGAAGLAEAGLPVGCLTTDFAMQNVLAQLGVGLVSVEGMVIKRLRSWILRCHGCFATTSVMTKKFCPACGNATLKRVSVSVDPKTGERNIHISTRRPLNTRGLIFSLPKPRGGKHSQNPLLVEDQPMPDSRLARKAAKALSVPDEPFLLHDVTSKGAAMGLRGHGQQTPATRNPNNAKPGRKRGGKRR